MDQRIRRAARPRLDRVRADLREPRRHDGREQPASAWPDLVHRLYPRRAGRRNQGTARAPGPHRPLPALRLSRRGTCRRRERVIFENDHFAALVPWWAVWPFEVLLVSRRHLGAMPELTSDERDALADALKRITTRYDNLFETSFPYTMGFHQSPTDEAARIRSGTSTRTSIRRCCARPRCANSWWVLKCWACRSATSRPKRRRASARLLRDSLLARGLKPLQSWAHKGSSNAPHRPIGQAVVCGRP